MQVLKNKILKVLSLLLTFNSVYGIGYDTLNLKHEFNELTIKYIYGDEYYTVEEMKFVKSDEKIFGVISMPDNSGLENSKTELTAKDISSIDSFLTKAYQFKENCDEVLISSYVRYYSLNIDGKKFTIRKFCEWGDSNYLQIKEQIFGVYLNKLDEKRELLNQEKNKLLIGLWKYDFSIHKIVKGKLYTLNRLNSKSNQKCFLRFKEEQELVDHYCLNNSKTHYNFKFDIIDNELLLFINGLNNKKRKEFVYGYVFKVVKLNENEIKLTPRY